MSDPNLNAKRMSLVRVVDLNIGEETAVTLSNDQEVTLQLLNVQEAKDEILNAVFQAEVTVRIDHRTVKLSAGLFNLPVTHGDVQLDCSVTKGSVSNSHMDHWGLAKDARIRLWPAGSPLTAPGTFAYPVKQQWFACGLWAANEPMSPRPNNLIYCHAGVDIGGAEGLTEVVSSTDGLVITSGDQVLSGYEDLPERDDHPMLPGYDIVTILDDRGWCFRYVHLFEIDTEIRVGKKVQLGQRIGLLGKEGGSGGWSHLHFEIKSVQPSGKWGTQESYALLHEAFCREYGLKLMAMAQPRYVGWVDEEISLDGRRSWVEEGDVDRYEWQFSDGTTDEGSQVTRVYECPGTYSEILKTHQGSEVAINFARVTILDRTDPDVWPPRVHPAYYPTQNIKPEEPITFLVRAFRSEECEVIWDFGDGSSTVIVQSDGGRDAHAQDGYSKTVHRYEKPGRYLVSVERTNQDGFEAIAHLDVLVGNG